MQRSRHGAGVFFSAGRRPRGAAASCRIFTAAFKPRATITQSNSMEEQHVWRENTSAGGIWWQVCLAVCVRGRQVAPRRGAGLPLTPSWTAAATSPRTHPAGWSLQAGRRARGGRRGTALVAPGLRPAWLQPSPAACLTARLMFARCPDLSTHVARPCGPLTILVGIQQLHARLHLRRVQIRRVAGAARGGGGEPGADGGGGGRG